MKKVVIYLRTSSDRQIDNTSIPTQESICRGYCEREGLEIYDIQKREAVSAKSENYERIIDLIQYCKKHNGKFEILLVYKLDRFARDTLQHLTLREELRKLNIVLRSTTETIDETPAGKLFEGMVANFNQYDNEIRKERVTNGMYRRVEEGLWPWQLPLGYCRNRVNGVRLTAAVFDPACYQDVIDIFKLYSLGVYTFSSLADFMNKRIVKNYKGKKIHFMKQEIKRILNYSFYIGLLKPKRGKLTPGKHKALISMELWNKCQEIQLGKSNHSINKRLIEHPDFPLRRFTSCGVCHHPLTAGWSKSHTGKHYAYYYCVNKGCKKYAKMLTMSDLHEEFISYLCKTKPKEKYLPLFKEVFIDRYNRRQKDFKSDYLKQVNELDRLKKEKLTIAEKGAKGIIPDLTLTELLANYEKKILTLQQSISKINNKELDIETFLDEGLNAIRTIDKEWSDALPEKKPRLERLVFPEGVNYHFKGFSNPRLAPAFAVPNQFALCLSRNVVARGLEPLTFSMSMKRSSQLS